MEKVMRAMRVLIAVMSVLVCLLLCWQTADIYRAGNRAENFSAPGVRIEPVYSRQIVAERLEAIAPALYVYAAVAAVGLVLQAAVGERTKARAVRPEETPEGDARRVCGARLTLLAAGLLLLALGAMNGGARDVLVKAVNICTECIGLG